MTGSDSADPLARAIELSMRFDSSHDAETVEAFLCEHEELRELLEPLLDGAPPDDERQVLGDFELVRELGRGGMGVVYEAVQTMLGRTVALKLLPPHRAMSPRALAMFRREATLAASLDHPGIARVLEFQEVDGQLALAMELVDGIPLDDVLENLEDQDPTTATAEDLAAAAGVTIPDSDLSRRAEAWRGSYVQAAVELTRQVAEALAHAHSRGVVHRDVKPGNILITPGGRAVLTDFGLAREEGALGLTRTGEFSGTYQYAAPEQLEGRLDEIDGRADVYALGATLYELLTLQRPLDAQSLSELIQLIKREDPAPPSRHNHNVGTDLESVVMFSLEKDPQKRYASADEFATDLQNVLSDRPVKARRLTTTARTLRWVGRNRLVSAFIALLVVSVTLAGAFWTHAVDAKARYENIWVGAALESLEERGKHAHPPWPARAGELHALLAQLEGELLPMRATLQRDLRALRAGHVRAGQGPRSADRPPHPARARIEALRGEETKLSVELLDKSIAPAARAAAEAEVAEARREIEALNALAAESARVEIRDPRTSALHDRLEEQLFRLQQAERELLPDLRFRAAWAAGVHARTIDEHKVQWAKAIAEVASDARFGGLKLQPQVGLVPLGPDPGSKLQEFAHALSGAIPVRGADGRLQLGLEHGVVFVLMPGGDFSREEPLKYSVRLDPFFIAKHELGRAQWQRLARGLHGLRWRDGGIADVRNHGELEKPVNAITWEMCDRLFQRYGIDLPTAAQWEYAAMFDGGVDATPEVIAKVANLCDLSYAEEEKKAGRRVRAFRWDDGFADLAPIHSMGPTPAGLHHLLGNVSEWCRDVYYLDNKSLAQRAAPRDGDGLRESEAPPSSRRVVQGSHWQSVNVMQLYDRHSSTSALRSVGVRPIRRLIPEAGK